jgi:hypothetical protein
MMRVVSRDVIEHLSQTRVISSEHRYPSLGDISEVRVRDLKQPLSTLWERRPWPIAASKAMAIGDSRDVSAPEVSAHPQPLMRTV